MARIDPWTQVFMQRETIPKRTTGDDAQENFTSNVWSSLFTVADSGSNRDSGSGSNSGSDPGSRTNPNPDCLVVVKGPPNHLQHVGGEPGEGALEEDVVPDDDKLVSHSGLVRLLHNFRQKNKKQNKVKEGWILIMYSKQLTEAPRKQIKCTIGKISHN